MTRTPNDKIKAAIVETLKLQFAEPDFDFDGCNLRFVDADDTSIYLGLHSLDEETGDQADAAELIISIEVSQLKSD